MKKIYKLIFIQSIAIGLFTSTQLMGQQAFFSPAPVPTAKTIAAKVLQATVPKSSYTVTVNQRIEAPQKSMMKQAVANQAAAPEAFQTTTQFRENYDVNSGLKAQKIVRKSIPKMQSFTSQAVSNQPRLVKQGSVRLVIDVSAFFKTVNAWNDVKVSVVTVNHQKYFKVSGKIKTLGFEFLINSTHYYVSKLDLYVENKRYAETTFQYNEVNQKYWLPTDLTYIQYPAGNRITQEFGSYVFK